MTTPTPSSSSNTRNAEHQVPWHFRYSVVPTLIMALLILAIILFTTGIINDWFLIVLLLTLAPAYMGALSWNSTRVIKYEQRA